jgi:hypothetical protein
MSFNVQPGSTSTIIVKTSYPWANVASILPQQCILVSFTIGPFPANINGSSTIPGWLHVSLSAPSIEITYLASPSVGLMVAADKTAPRGSAGSFELQAHYIDSASGVSATEDIPISIDS